MKTQFQLINEIKSSAKPYILESDDIFNAYVIQRGLSMMRPSICDLLNDTTNSLYESLDPQMSMNLWKLIIPKTKEYSVWIKKEEKDTAKAVERTKIKEVAKLLERSEKTIKLMLEIDPDFLKQFEEKAGISKSIS